MKNVERRGLLDLLAALPIAATATPAGIRLPVLTPGQLTEFQARWHADSLAGHRPMLMPGETFHSIHPGPTPEPSALAPAGWDTLENVR